MPKLILLLSLPCILGTAVMVQAAPSNSLEEEYQQVRTIALRDTKVQAAYRDADRKLEAKILQIDPTLESYLKERQGVKPPVKMSKSARTSQKAKSDPVTVKAAGSMRTHVVAAGETLGSIAGRYGVSVSALKTANQIKDERKLRVGQALTIPGAKKTGQKKEEDFWSKFSHRS